MARRGGVGFWLPCLNPLSNAEQVVWGWLGTFIAQSRNTSITSTEHGHTRGLDRGFQGGPFPCQPGQGEEGSSGFRPQRIAPRLPSCCVSPDSPEKTRGGLRLAQSRTARKCSARMA
jgi:hypothetical protein